MTLFEFLNDWLENYHRENVKHQTYVRYKSNIHNYIQTDPIGNKDFDKITRKDLQEFMLRMRQRISIHGKKLAPGTINNTLIVIQSAYKYALDYELVDKSPCVQIHRVPKDYSTDSVKCYTIQEQLKMEEWISLHHNKEYACYLFDLYTGLRIGELCGLRWDDVDFNEGTISIHQTVYNSQDDAGKWVAMIDTPKTRTSYRTIPLPDHLLDLLRDLYKTRDCEYVFSTNEKMMTPWTMRYRYDEMVKSIGMRHINFHGLRHTFATRALENGMDVKTLSEILGHSNPAVTLNVYTHSMLEHKKFMMDKMQRIPRSPLTPQ